jgi:hypothetical protein
MPLNYRYRGLLGRIDKLSKKTGWPWSYYLDKIKRYAR